MSAPDSWWGLAQQGAAKPIDWGRVGRFAWFVLNCAHVCNGGRPVPWPDTPTPSPPRRVAETPRTPSEAANLLGVLVDADRDEVRAALRAKMGNGAHPDHGGDPEIAKKMIAAKNLLIERARERV